MKNCDAMRPIVLRGTEAVKATEDAINRSLSNGRAVQTLKKAVVKKPILKAKSES